MQHRGARTRVATALAAILLAACRGAPAPDARPLALGFETSAVTLDPHLHDDQATHTTLEHFYGRLVAFGPDLSLVPDLALTWQNPSETVWRIRLKAGVTFHDGRPLDAEDVIESLRRARALPGSRVAYYLRGVVDVRALDRLTVDIVTSGPSPVLLNRLAFVAIVPRGTPDAPITRPVGTGPYRFVSGTPGGAIEGERYERYHRVPPRWPRVRIVSMPDAAARAEAVPAGLADAVARFPHERVVWARSQPSLRVVSRPGLGTTLLGFSVRPGSRFADLRVRQAIEVAIDRGTLLPAAEGDGATPTAQLVPTGVFGHVASVPVRGRDLERARRLLAEAGLGGGLSATLVLPEPARDVGVGLAAQLSRAGVRLDVEALPRASLYSRFESDPPELFLVTWAAETGDASELLEALFHTPGNGLGHANRFGYSNREVDALVERAGATLDPVDRRDALWAAFALLRADLPAIPLVVRENLYGLRAGIEWTPGQYGRLLASDLRPATNGTNGPP